MGAASTIPIVVLGAGPAGLAAAWLLARRGGFDVTVLERGTAVGGNAGSFQIAGVRADYGSHRLHPACPPAILSDVRTMLGEELLDRPRHGRIRLHRRWLHFPLKPLDLALQVPPAFLCGVLWDAATRPLRKNVRPTFAGVLEAGLGPTICRDFYFPYAKKIWGLPPEELDAEQARRRVSTASLSKLLQKVARNLPGVKGAGGGRYFYPRGGFGRISEAYCAAAAAAGANIRLNAPVSAVEVNERGVAAVLVDDGKRAGRTDARHVFSTIPLPALVRAVRPQAPPEILASAEALRYRALILAYLVLETPQFTEYDAHYFPDSGVAMTRLSEPKNYGLAGDPRRTVLCAELPCNVDDPAWSLSDAELGELVRDDLTRVGLPIGAPVLEVATRRLRQAYPIYTRGFHEHFQRLDHWIRPIEGLTTLGRQGLFAHDNTHHALAMAYAAVECLRADGSFDNGRWAEHRLEFETHVVED